MWNQSDSAWISTELSPELRAMLRGYTFVVHKIFDIFLKGMLNLVTWINGYGVECFVLLDYFYSSSCQCQHEKDKKLKCYILDLQLLIASINLKSISAIAFEVGSSQSLWLLRDNLSKPHQQVWPLDSILLALSKNRGDTEILADG